MNFNAASFFLGCAVGFCVTVSVEVVLILLALVH
jgi:hypothetical protein